MSPNKVIPCVGAGALALAVFVAILTPERFVLRSECAMGSVLRELLVAMRSGQTQWLALICTGIYFFAITAFSRRTIPGLFWHMADRDVWLLILLLIAGTSYGFNYASASQSIDALIFIISLCLGKCVGLWRLTNSKPTGFGQAAIVIAVFVILLSGLSFWQPAWSRFFEYRGQPRWSGIWENPNTFGLLMAVGLVLGLGLILFLTSFGHSSLPQTRRVSKAGLVFVVVGIFGIAAVLFGLLKSYSRGAWFATACGSGFLLIHCLRSPRQTRFQGVVWLREYRLPITAIFAALCITGFWQFRHAEHSLSRRIFSVGNGNDFSKLNRLAAWEGTLQMMADKPFAGFGWGRPEPVYNHLYCLNKVEEGMAIQMNDYLTLGTVLGLPGLFCFLAYVAISLSQIIDSRVRISMVCASAVIVFLVGFLFDGGLFKTALGAPFLVLLELGWADAQEPERLQSEKGTSMNQTSD